MTETPKTLPERNVFQPRSGVDIAPFVAVLEAEPQMPLSDQDKQTARQWNADLARGNVSIDGKEYAVFLDEGITLDEVQKGYSYLTKVHEISLDYFATTEGRQLLRGSGMIDEAAEPTTEEIRELFMCASYGAASDAIKKLALASKKAEDGRMADELVSGQVPRPPERIRVFSDATNLMVRLQTLKAYKSFFREVGHGILEGDNDSGRRTKEDLSPLDQAKLMYVELQQEVVNAELATIYPDVLNFWYQAGYFPEPQKQMLRGAIEHAWPLVRHVRENYLRDNARRLFVRLDHLRNGVERTGTGPFGSVSNELREYLEGSHPDTKNRGEHLLLSTDEIELFDQIVFDANDMKGLAETLLAGLGLLSEETGPVSKDRPHRAKDGKWQVIIRDDISSMGAEDPPGILEIPANFSRNLTKSTPPAGVIPGIAHELKHIFQHENHRAQGEDAAGIGATVDGKNKTVYAEAGAIQEEKWVQEHWFGRSRDDNPHYMRAMLVVQGQEAGEGETVEGRAIKAFYDSYRQANPDEAPQKAAAVAVSRVMRLVRRKGGYDSQPLNYAESALLIDKTEHLSPHIKGLLFDLTSYDIRALASLHTFDLLPDRVQHFPRDKFTAIVLEYIRNKVTERTET